MYGVVVCMEVLQAVRRQKRSSARTCRFCTFRRDKGGTGREVRPRLPARRAGAGLAAVFFVRQNRQRRFLPQRKKGGAGVPAAGCNASGVVISVLMGEKTVLARGFAVQFIAVKRNMERRFLSQNKYGMGILYCGTG